MEIRARQGLSSVNDVCVLQSSVRNYFTTEPDSICGNKKVLGSRRFVFVL